MGCIIIIIFFYGDYIDYSKWGIGLLGKNVLYMYLGIVLFRFIWGDNFIFFFFFIVVKCYVDGIRIECLDNCKGMFVICI